MTKEFRGVIHIHTPYCDGLFELQELKEYLKKEGLDFACLTPHEAALEGKDLKTFQAECSRLSDDSFLLIPGLERHLSFSIHRLDLGIPARVTILAHPATAGFTIPTRLIGQIDGLEVWNPRYDGTRFPSPTALRVLTGLRKKNYQILAFAGLDLHELEPIPFVIEVQVAAAKEGLILEALKRGKYQIISQRLVMGSAGDIKFRNPLHASGWWRAQQNLSDFAYQVGGKTKRGLDRLGIKVPERSTKIIRRFLGRR